MGIRISEKHGVNPSVEKCFWCGESMGVILFGALKGDVEAPREVVTGYDPCDKCKKIIAQGCWCIEVHDHPTDRGRNPIQKQGNQELYPTGRFSVLKHEAAARIFGNSGITEESEAVFVDEDVFNWLQKPFEKKKKKLSKKPSTWPKKRKENENV